MRSHPIKEIWIAEEIKYDYYEYDSEAHVKRLLGIFSTKAGAMGTAKEAFDDDYKGFCHVTGETPTPLFGSDGKMKKVEETGWKNAGRLMGQLASAKDNSTGVGESGGLLYKVEYHGYSYQVSIRKITLDKYVESNGTVWLVQEAERDLYGDTDFYGEENKLVGFYFYKSTALKIAKEVFTRNYKVSTTALKEKQLSGREKENRKAMEAILEERPTSVTDHSAEVGESGGVLYKANLHQQFEYEVSFEKASMDKHINKAIQIR